jgi:hypothetical protein
MKAQREWISQNFFAREVQCSKLASYWFSMNVFRNCKVVV